MGRNLQGHAYSGAAGLFDYDTYDDLGPGATIAICDYNHGNPGLAGGAMLANEFIRLPYQFMAQVPPWVAALGPGAQGFRAQRLQAHHRRYGPGAGDAGVRRARAGGSRRSRTTGAFRWRGFPAGATRTPSKSGGFIAAKAEAWLKEAGAIRTWQARSRQR